MRRADGRLPTADTDVDRRLDAGCDVAVMVAVGPRASLVRGRDCRLPADADGVVVGVEQPRWQRRSPLRTRSGWPVLLLLLGAPAGVVGFEVFESSRARVVKDVGVDGDDAALLTVAPVDKLEQNYKTNFNLTLNELNCMIKTFLGTTNMTGFNYLRYKVLCAGFIQRPLNPPNR